MPKKGKNIIKFKDHHKSLKLPVVIYADFETINHKAHGCEPNPQNMETDNSSWTKIKTKHKCSGYSYTFIIISSHSYYIYKTINIIAAAS